MDARIAERHNRLAKEDPFFILYASRSGSTFLANELTKKFRVAIAPETDFITYTLGQYGHVPFQSDAQLDSLTNTIMLDPKFSDLKISRRALRELFGSLAPMSLSDVVRAVLDLYRRQCGLDHYRYGFKKGTYVDHYRDLLRVFPSAKFVGLIRDGRAVFHSQKNSIGSGSRRPMANDAKKAARKWVRFTKMMRDLELDHPGVLIVNYETLIQDSEKTVARIARFLDADPIPRAAQPRKYEIPERYGRELHRNVDKAPLIDRISAWQSGLQMSEIAEYESVACDCLVYEGYDLMCPPKSGMVWAKWLSS